MEKQPSEAELEAARRRARADAEERFASEASGREPDDQPGDAGPYAYAAEAVQAEYARVYEDARPPPRRLKGPWRGLTPTVAAEDRGVSTTPAPRSA